MRSEREDRPSTLCLGLRSSSLPGLIQALRLGENVPGNESVRFCCCVLHAMHNWKMGSERDKPSCAFLRRVIWMCLLKPTSPSTWQTHEQLPVLLLPLSSGELLSQYVTSTETVGFSEPVVSILCCDSTCQGRLRFTAIGCDDESVQDDKRTSAQNRNVSCAEYELISTPTKTNVISGDNMQRRRRHAAAGRA